MRNDSTDTTTDTRNDMTNDSPDHAGAGVSAREQLVRLWRHAEWADAELLAALVRLPDPPADAMREYAHVLAAEELWLARIEHRLPRVGVWPALTAPDAVALAAQLRNGYARLLATLDDGSLAAGVSYTNSAGRAFVTPLGDILLHVALHGQYHRGKINLLLRQADLAPAPADFISFARGVPAATTNPLRP